MEKKTKIVCVGAGYVGGPTMAIIALKCPEYYVYVYDMNRTIIDAWNSDNLPVYEIGLKEIIEKTRKKNLFFTSDLQETLNDCQILFLAVNTPTKKQGKGKGNAPDMQYFENAIREITMILSEKKLNEDIVIVEKSTIPVKTSEFIRAVFTANQIKFPENKDKLVILSNPEFMAEGTAISDLISPDRVIIGADNNISGQKGMTLLKSIYQKWIPEEKILTSNLFSSELTKLASNSFLAQRISSINSISMICEKVGADVDEVSRMVGADSRIGGKFLKSSVGFGGSCLMKDVLHMIYLCETLGLSEVANYWQAVLDINELQKKRFSYSIITSMFNNLNEKKIAILGVTFKKNTNDIRESAALDIANNLLKEGALLNIYDPKASEQQFRNHMYSLGHVANPEDKSIKWFDNAYEACESCHAIVVLTEWDEFTKLDYQNIFNKMAKPAYVFDGRNLLNKEHLEKIGYKTVFIGKTNNTVF